MKKTLNHFTRMFRECRKHWSKYNPDRRQVIKDSRITIDGLVKHTCTTCSGNFALSEIEVDHIHPIGTNSPTDLPTLLDCISKLLSKELQVLCKACHHIKTKCEMRQRELEINVDKICEYFCHDFDIDFIRAQIETLDTSKLFVRAIEKTRKVLHDPKKLKKASKELNNLVEAYF